MKDDSRFYAVYQILLKDLASQILVFMRRARPIMLTYNRFPRQSEAHGERVRANKCIYSLQFKIRNLPTEHVIKILRQKSVGVSERHRGSPW